MLEKYLSYVMHAYLHRHQNRVFLARRVTVPQFIENNRELLNTIYKAIIKEFPEAKALDHNIRLQLEIGIQRYLMAENMNYTPFISSHPNSNLKKPPR